MIGPFEFLVAYNDSILQGRHGQILVAKAPQSGGHISGVPPLPPPPPPILQNLDKAQALGALVGLAPLYWVTSLSKEFLLETPMPKK